MDERTRKLLERAFHPQTPDTEASVFFIKAKEKLDLYDEFLTKRAPKAPVSTEVVVSFSEPAVISCTITMPMHYFADLMNKLWEFQQATGARYTCQNFDHRDGTITSPMTLKVILYGTEAKCGRFNAYLDSYLNEVNKALNPSGSHPSSPPRQQKSKKPKGGVWSQWKKAIFS